MKRCLNCNQKIRRCPGLWPCQFGGFVHWFWFPWKKAHTSHHCDGDDGPTVRTT